MSQPLSLLDIAAFTPEGQAFKQAYRYGPTAVLLVLSLVVVILLALSLWQFKKHTTRAFVLFFLAGLIAAGGWYARREWKKRAPKL